MKRILGQLTTLLFLLMAQIGHAQSEALFYVALNPTTNNLDIKSSMPYRYQAAGIKVNTPGFTPISGCTPAPNGYCLFAVDNLTPASIELKGSSNLVPVNVNITLCLNGQAALSCGNYNFVGSFLTYFAGTSCGAYDFIWIDTTGLRVGGADEASYAVNLGSHPINLYGIVYSQLYMSTNGVISSVSNTTFENTALPTTVNFGNALFVYWDDLNSTRTTTFRTAGLYYQYFDTCPRLSADVPGEGCHVFQWNTYIFNTTIFFNMEAIIYDQTGTVVYQYGSGNTQAGSSSTSGAQNASRSSYVQLQYNQAESVLPNSMRCLKYYND